MDYRLKTRSTFPPGGWIYVQKETGWNLPEGLTFDQSVKAIFDHRQANNLFAKHSLPADMGKIAAELDEVTCLRLVISGAHKTYCREKFPSEKKNPLSSQVTAFGASLSSGLIGTPSKPSPSPLQPQLNPVSLTPFQQGEKSVGAKLVERLRNSASGVKALTEWLGDGGLPVTQEQADQRASSCGDCQLNDVNFSGFTKSVAGAIKRHLQVKNKLELKAHNEEKLGACGACGCNLPLKVWTPLQYIKENTSEEVLSKLAEGCWIKAEMAQ